MICYVLKTHDTIFVILCCYTEKKLTGQGLIMSSVGGVFRSKFIILYYLFTKTEKYDFFAEISYERVKGFKC